MCCGLYGRWICPGQRGARSAQVQAAQNAIRHDKASAAGQGREQGRRAIPGGVQVERRVQCARRDIDRRFECRRRQRHPCQRSPDGKARRRVVNALHAATDVYTWKLLRRDLGVTRAETERTMVRLVDGTLGRLDGDT